MRSRPPSDGSGDGRSAFAHMDGCVMTAGGPETSPAGKPAVASSPCATRTPEVCALVVEGYVKFLVLSIDDLHL